MAKRNRVKISRSPAAGRGPVAPPRLAPEALKFLASYKSISSARQGIRSRQPIERGTEETSQLKPFDRLEAIAIGRDLNRNNPKAITIIEQRKVLSVGFVRAQFNTSDEAWNAAADRVFNRYFARDCFFECPMHLDEVAQMIDSAKMREGDILLAYDDFLLDSGKVMLWEADQLVEVDPGEWENPAINERWRYDELQPDGSTISRAYTQDQGVIVDQYKRVVAYCVTSLNLADQRRPALVLPYREVLIIPADCARLIKHRFRIGQRRGVPSLLPVADNLADIDEMIKSELSTARMRSKIMGWVKHAAEAGLAPDQAAMVEAMLEQAAAAQVSENGDAAPLAENPDAAALNPQTVQVLKRYLQVEEALGGRLDYLEDGDSIEVPNIDRPNLDTSTFYDALGDGAGASQGLARAYTRMAATSSYTAHRGETCMTDRHTRKNQKAHEHDWLDWLAVKVLSRAIALGKLAPGPEDWEYLVSWSMPRPDAIDPEKEAKADLQNLKNGKLTLRDIIGPQWRDHLMEYAEQLREARDLSIPLAIFETVAGAVAAPAEQAQNGSDQE